MLPPITRTDRLAVVIYGCLTVAIAFTDYYLRRYPDYTVTSFVPGVIDGSYEAPFIFRPLMPFVLHWVTELTGVRPMIGFLASRVVFIAGALIALHAYLRVWFSSAASLGATATAAALLPLSFTNSWAHPDSFPDLFLFTLGCLAVATRRDALLGALVVIGTLNRETTLFLVLLWMNLRLREERSRATVGRALALTLLWAGVFFTIRWWRGFVPYEAWMLGTNLTLLNPGAVDVDLRLRAFAYFWLALLGGPAYLAARGLRLPDAPEFFRRAWEVALALFVTGLLFGSIVEPRIFLPIVPLLAPAAVAAVQHAARQDDTDPP